MSHYKILLPLLFLFLLAGCHHHHYERLIVRQKVGNDTLIIKEIGGEVLTGGIVVFRKTKDSLHKTSIIDDVYTDAKIVGFNSQADSLLVEFRVVHKDQLMRTDTLCLPWSTYIESQELDH